jgi:phage gp29-like protein
MWYDYTDETYRMYAEDGEHVIKPGDGKWLVLEDGYRGWMHGAVRSLAIPFFVRSCAVRDWGRHSERHGMPLIKVKHPGVAEDTEIDGILDELRALANEVSVSLPQNVDGQGTGWDLDLLEAKANDWQGFVSLLDHCAREYDIRILGQNLSTEIDGGSRAAATVHDAAFDGIVDGDAELLATDLHEQLVKPWTAVNFGKATPVPWPKWERASSTNALELKRRAESIDMLGKAMSSIKTAGYKLSDPDDFARQFGIQIEEIPEDEKPQPVAPLPNEQPEDDDAQGGSGEESDGDDSKPATSE